jgi:hypothetical protein
MRVLKYFSSIMVLAAFTILPILGLASDAEAYRSITSRMNGVTVDVKPIQFAPGKPAKFQVRMNTHTMDLAEDMTVVSTLRDDQGREYGPVSWKGSPPGGHHRRGVLMFPALEGNPKSVTLVIRNIANVTERIFEWKVE